MPDFTIESYAAVMLLQEVLAMQEAYAPDVRVRVISPYRNEGVYVANKVAVTCNLDFATKPDLSGFSEVLKTLHQSRAAVRIPLRRATIQLVLPRVQTQRFLKWHRDVYGKKGPYNYLEHVVMVTNDAGDDVVLLSVAFDLLVHDETQPQLREFADMLKLILDHPKARAI